MTHALSLSSGAAAISLSSSGCFLTHYVPNGPELTADGDFKNVTEAVEFVITGATSAAVQTKLNQIERILSVVNQRLLTGTGAKAYLHFQAGGDASPYRSELLGYRLILDDDAAVALNQLTLGVKLIVTRRPYWEGARTAIPLSNGNGSNILTGLLVRNHNDSGAGDDNWCDIAASSITGSLPAPLEVRMSNASGATRWYRHWHISNNIYSPSLAHIIEGEAALSGYGTTGSDAACSNGQYRSRTAIGWLTFRWNVPPATLDLFAGRYVRILARFRWLSNSPRDARVTLYDFAGLYPLAQSPQTVLRGGHEFIQDCGALPFPAADYSTNWAVHVLELAVNVPTSETIDLDFIQLTPTEPMLYRKLIQLGYQTPVGDAVVDDGIEGLTYYEDGLTGLRYPIYIARSEPVHVWPGVDQRLLILHDGSGQLPSWSVSVQAWYRPRRTLL